MSEAGAADRCAVLCQPETYDRQCSAEWGDWLGYVSLTSSRGLFLISRADLLIKVLFILWTQIHLQECIFPGINEVFRNNQTGSLCLVKCGGRNTSELNDRLLYPRDQMFIGTAWSQIYGLMHVVAEGNSSWSVLRKRGGGWMNTQTLRLLTPLFQKQPPTHPFSNTRGEWKRERESDSMPILLPSPSKDRQLGDYF